MSVVPYLFFAGRCDEAIAFYQKAVGAAVDFRMTYRESPDASSAFGPEWADKVMHATLNVAGSRVNVSDGQPGAPCALQGFALTLTLPDEAAVRKAFAALSEGGAVRMPLGPTFFSPTFGMAVDRFGVLWIIIQQH